MNLRLTTLILIAITFAGLSLVLSVTTRVVLIRHFEELEQQAMLINLERMNAVVDAEFDTLSRISRDWAGGIQGDQLSVRPETLTALDISLLLLLDTQGKPASGFFMKDDHLLLLSDHMEQSDFDPAPFMPVLLPQEMQGVVSFQNQPLLLVSRPVFDAPSGQTLGWLLVGRMLDMDALARLGDLIQLPVELMPYDPGPGSMTANAVEAFQDGKEAYVQVLDESRIAGYGLLTDVEAQPAYLVQIEQSRLVSLSGQRVMSLISVALIVIGIVFTVITILFLELLVTARLARLGREVNAIRSAGSLTQRVTVSRRDELAELGKDINAMLDTLEQSQAHRLEAQNELSARVSDLQTLNSTAVLLLGQLEAPNTREMVCRLAVEMFGADMAWMGTSSRGQNSIQPAAAFGCSLKKVEPLQPKAGSKHNPAVQAVISAQAVVSSGPVVCAGETWYAQAAFPLPVEPGQSAVLNLYRRSQAFSAESVQILEAYSNLASVALQNVLLFHQVRNGRKRLEMLSRRLVELQEEERKRIAMELHDEIGQILTGLNLMLNPDLFGKQAEQQERLENARKLINELIGRVRQMSLNLRPAMLDDLGLLPTLLWHFENYTRQTGIRVQFQHDGVAGERYSSDIETAVYRVIQEALTNVARHASVDVVQVQVWAVEQVVNVQVEDEGRGFDPEETAATAGKFGLLGMQERAIALRGSLLTDSRPGGGTTLLLQLPLRGTLERRNYGRDYSAGG